MQLCEQSIETFFAKPHLSHSREGGLSRYVVQEIMEELSHALVDEADV